MYLDRKNRVNVYVVCL